MNNLNNEELSLLEEILNDEIIEYAVSSGYGFTNEYIVSLRNIIKKLGLKEISDYDKWGKYYECIN